MLLSRGKEFSASCNLPHPDYMAAPGSNHVFFGTDHGGFNSSVVQRHSCENGAGRNIPGLREVAAISQQTTAAFTEAKVRKFVRNQKRRPNSPSRISLPNFHSPVGRVWIVSEETGDQN